MPMHGPERKRPTDENEYNPEQQLSALSKEKKELSVTPEEKEMQELIDQALNKDNRFEMYTADVREDLLTKFDAFSYQGYSLHELLMAVNTADKPADQHWRLFMGKESIAISPGSRIAKLLQIYLELHNITVQHEDNEVFAQAIDGIIGEDTLKAISLYQESAAVKNEVLDQLHEIEKERNAPLTDRVKSQFANILDEILNTDEPDYDIQQERSPSLEVAPYSKETGEQPVTIRAYGNKTVIDLKSGIIRVHGDGVTKEFPAGLHFDRDQETGEILIENNEDNDRVMQEGIQMALFFNKIMEIHIERNLTEDTDDYRPYHATFRGIEINDSWGFNDTQVISDHQLQQWLKDYNATYESEDAYLDQYGNEVDKQTFVEFMNDLYVAHNKPENPNQAHTEY